ncbi:hypothetical protein EYF80_065688 [Liparis tanakae]|uniref:Uncharacterized protein n=1 Tax=Liparis tanakae TaxID=230148 RepID=A0A4Z2E5X2_9TELE|nr:hypothetical protein EYF80_065688 [Liparis tanakae]
MVGPGRGGVRGGGSDSRAATLGREGTASCEGGNLQVLTGHRSAQLLLMTCRRKDVNNVRLEPRRENTIPPSRLLFTALTSQR